MDVSVIIVNYNTASYVQKCLQSILQQTKDLEFEIIVVDNNSTNRDIEKLPLKFPGVRFYLRDKNDGFGAGCNFGAKAANGNYYAFINPDIVITDNVLLEFKNYLDLNRNTGLCSGLLTDSKGALIYSYNYFPGILWEFMETTRIGSKKKISSLLNRVEIKKNIPFEIDWALGALLFIRAGLFKELNGFDEDYFLYSEDSDLQLRIKNSGYKIFCLPGVRVMHEYGSSVKSKDGQLVYNYHINRSKMIYMYKHFGLIKRNLIRVLFITGTVLRILFLPFIIRKNYSRSDGFKKFIKSLSIFLSGHNKVLHLR